MPNNLNASSLSTAVQKALSMRDGAERIADGFEELLGESIGTAGAEPVISADGDRKQRV